jgi:hypothetical protein
LPPVATDLRRLVALRADASRLLPTLCCMRPLTATADVPSANIATR